jgi:predicted dehydrogenase
VGRHPENRLYGTQGIIEVGVADAALRVLAAGKDWEEHTLPEDENGEVYIVRGVQDLVDALQDHHEPELSAAKALRATELIFATYESSRRRARVDLPLDIEDSPLRAMIDAAGSRRTA